MDNISSPGFAPCDYRLDVACYRMDLICSESASKHSLRVRRAFNVSEMLAVELWCYLLKHHSTF